jgi:hypothetical protein
MSKKVRFSNPESTTFGGGISNLGLIISSLMPRTVNVCRDEDDSIFCNVTRLISFFFMICLIIFIVYVVYKLLTGKLKLRKLMDNLLGV